VGTVVNFRTGGRHPTTVPKAAIEHWDGTSWSIVASTNPDPSGPSDLDGIAAISANDIWAVGTSGGAFVVPTAKTLTEHWDGTSWSIIPSPSPAQDQNQLFAVTALSDGTVAAVGHQEDVNTDQPLILQNAASAPQAPSSAAPVRTTSAPTETAEAILGLSSERTPATLLAGENQTLLVFPDKGPVDQFFALASKPDTLLSHAGRSWRARASAPDGDLDGFLGDI
jgi:hypothetical protein